MGSIVYTLNIENSLESVALLILLPLLRRWSEIECHGEGILAIVRVISPANSRGDKPCGFIKLLRGEV